MMNNAEETVVYLFETHADQINKFAFYMLGDRGEAEDAVQEVFLRIARSIHQVKSPYNLKAWMWSIAHHYVYDVSRKRTRRGEYPVMPEQFASVAIHSADPTLAMVLAESIASLPLKQRQIVILRLMKDLSVEEVAQIIGCSTGHVRVVLHRATSRLKAILE